MKFQAIVGKYTNLVNLNFITFYDKDLNIINNDLLYGNCDDKKVEFIHVERDSNVNHALKAHSHVIDNFRNHIRNNGYINLKNFRVKRDGWYCKSNSNIDYLLKFLY